MPIAGAAADGDDLKVAYAKSLVKDAPKVDADGELEPEEEARLYQHYGRSDYQSWDDKRDVDVTSTAGKDSGHDTSGPETDEAMTRSEEELAVGTRSVESGRVRLRKYVVTENVTTTVPVRKETVRVQREPITDANRDAAMAGGDITEEEHEVILHEEEPVVSKQAVPKERVRLDEETVTEEKTVTDDVRKEKIEIEGDTDQT
ncbi:MAG: YsnF/AvaK domain-containing protein [Acidimicrobiales bacterium]